MGSYPGFPTSAGGRGARMQATLAVVPGQVLTLYVGGSGRTATLAGTGLGSGGGYNGGGNGGQDNYRSAGGGGASVTALPPLAARPPWAPP